MSASILEDGADGFRCCAERLLLRVSFGHDLRQGRNQHGEPAARPRLQDDGKAVTRRHGGFARCTAAGIAEARDLRSGQEKYRGAVTRF
jgi:hypothetical protein